MSNEHIGRLQAIGLKKEASSGTPEASPTRYIPKVTGSFKPDQQVATDNAAYGVIDEVREVQTVSNITVVNLEGIMRDVFMGDILTAAAGQAFKCQAIPCSSVTGTFQEGETVTGGTSSATGIVKYIQQTGASAFTLYVVPTGTFQAAETITGGTSSASGTAGTLLATGTGSDHIFPRLNSNNHAAYTFFGHDPIGDEYASYCMLDSLDIEGKVGDYFKFNASYKGKKLVSTSGLTPSYAAENPFLPKFATLLRAADTASLYSASAVAVERFKMTVQKNVVPYQIFGDTDVNSLHNQQFGLVGELDLKYNATTWRDYMTASTKSALRLTVANTDNAITGSFYPTFEVEIPQAYITEWSRSEENNSLVRQTVGFRGVFNVSSSRTLIMRLRNNYTTAY
jgi:hypothetical protein